MKICIISSGHSCSDERVFQKETLTLAQAGYEITLITQAGNCQIPAHIKVISLPQCKGRFYRLFFLAYKSYRLARKVAADAYHFHDPELIPWMLRLKRATGRIIIYDVHEDFAKSLLSREWIPKILRKLVSGIFDRYEKRSASKFDCIVAATPGIADNFHLKNVVTVLNYPKLSDFSGIGSALYPAGKDFTAIYCGGLTGERGIKEIIKMLGFARPDYNVRLKLIGEFFDKSLRKEIEAMPEWSKVEFLGILPHTEVIRHFRGANVGLSCLWPLPNYIESLPVKIFEYMAAGLPVIASDFSLWREIIEGNNCGICVNPRDSREILKAVEFLIKNPEQARAMGENGRRAVLEKYNWEREGEKLLQIYAKFNREGQYKKGETNV